MRVLVVGAGAMGMLIAARFARAGIEVALVARSARRRARIAESGIEVRELDGSEMRAAVAIEGDATFDVAFICVKSFDVEAAAAQALARVAPKSALVAIANGLGNLETLERLAGAERACAGVADFGVLRRGENKVELRGAGKLRIGTRGAANVREIAALLARAGFASEVAPDIAQAIWTKAALNCAVNPLAALLEVENGVLPRTPAFAMAERAAEEVAAVARAAGVEVGDAWRERVTELCERTARNRCSMLEDLSEGRRTEIEQLSLAVEGRGRELAVATPVNRLLGTLVKAREESRAT